jgi:hypothetical protein
MALRGSLKAGGGLPAAEKRTREKYQLGSCPKMDNLVLYFMHSTIGLVSVCECTLKMYRYDLKSQGFTLPTYSTVGIVPYVGQTMHAAYSASQTGATVSLTVFAGPCPKISSSSDLEMHDTGSQYLSGVFFYSQMV